jgi:predicted  nucleic acid-binding Zn-ribbon protein
LSSGVEETDDFIPRYIPELESPRISQPSLSIPELSQPELITLDVDTEYSVKLKELNVIEKEVFIQLDRIDAIEVDITNNMDEIKILRNAYITEKYTQQTEIDMENKFYRIQGEIEDLSDALDDTRDELDVKLDELDVKLDELIVKEVDVEIYTWHRTTPTAEEEALYLADSLAESAKRLIAARKELAACTKLRDEFYKSVAFARSAAELAKSKSKSKVKV